MPFNNIREGGIRKNKFIFSLLQLQASLLLGILTWYARKRKRFIYVMASDKLKQAPFLALGACFSSFLTASFLIKGSTVAVRILPCLFVDVMVVASSFFYTLTTTLSPGMILLFYFFSSRSLATNLSLSSAALLSRHGGISLHLWTSPNQTKYTLEFLSRPSCPALRLYLQVPSYPPLLL
uniref:Uncharacterized protein n=1 Tax=Zelkova schneideriana TaxID=172643 RepID=A0A8F1SRE1_9ROSA|nr:hypothetical protein [Zelkova schneideriana]